MTTTLPKLDNTIRIRTDADLEADLRKIAINKRKHFAQFMRDELQAIVNREEIGVKKSGSRKKR